MFNNLFKNKSMNTNGVPRISLTEEKQLEKLQQDSYEKKILVFKHSSRCGISSMVLKRFENAMSSEVTNFDYYFLDIIKHRAISNALEDRFKIRHESPQLLVFKNGKVIADDSHYAILEMNY